MLCVCLGGGEEVLRAGGFSFSFFETYDGIGGYPIMADICTRLNHVMTIRTSELGVTLTTSL